MARAALVMTQFGQVTLRGRGPERESVVGRRVNCFVKISDASRKFEVDQWHHPSMAFSP
jgi:hypothetical protein